MRALVYILALLATPVFAATTYTVGPWKLVRSGSVQPGNYASPAECDAALRAQTVVVGSTVTFRCQQTVTARGVADPPVDPPPPPPPPGGDVRVSLTPNTYAVGGYSTIIWTGSSCTKSSSPAYAVWNETPGDDGGRSVAPNVTTTFTLTCANGTASAVLTVTGSAPVDPPPSGGGSGGGNPPPVTTLPVPSVLATPIVLPVNQIGANDLIRKYAQTAMRNWNFEGHVVADPFDRDQGYWSYDTCVQDYAVWLFDRPGAFWKLYELTGDVTYRTQAISDTQYFASHINAQGYFDCKTGEADTKYLVTRPFLTYERATGDQSLRAAAARAYSQSAQGFDVTYSPSQGLWTEREVGIHGDAALAYYELTGDTQALARAAALVKQWTDMAGQGVPLVSYTQHEGGGPGGSTPTDPVSSPWMAAMYFQFARNYWQVTGDEQVLRQVSQYFDWLDANALYDGSLFHPEFTGVTVPRYLAPSLIGDGGYDEGNLLHCPDVQGLVAFAVDAKGRLGQSIARAQQRLVELQACTQRMYANWTRETNYLPKYRIQAPRAFNWWLKGLYEAAR